MPEADPIMAEIAWRTPLGEERRILDTRLFSISAEEMKRRFWTKDEIAGWVEANCREDMLVAMQGTPPAHGWSFCPVHPDDLAPFQAWVAQPKRHVVLITMDDPTCEPLLREWMARHTTGAWEGVTLLTGPGKHVLRLTIRREQDAVFTRLRWSEPATVEELREALAD